MVSTMHKNTDDAVIQYDRIPDKKGRKIAGYLLLVPLLVGIIVLVSAITVGGEIGAVLRLVIISLALFIVVALPFGIILFFKKIYAPGAIFDERSGPDGIGVPDEIRGWNWAAAFLSIYWGIYFNVWLVFLSFIPIVNYFVWLWFGFKGNEMAWRAQGWPSVSEFKRVQNKWRPWGILVAGLGIAVILIGIINSVFYDDNNGYYSDVQSNRDNQERALGSVIEKTFSIEEKNGTAEALLYIEKERIAFESRPDYAFILDAVGYIIKKDYEKMDQMFQKAVGASDGYVDYRKVAALIRTSQREGLFPWDISGYAIKYLEKHIDDYPDDIVGYIDLSRIFIRDTKEPQKALGYMKIIENADVSGLDPDDQSEYYWALCRSYMDTAQIKIAYGHCLYEAENFPSHSSINNLGVINEQLGNLQEALESYDKARKLLPSSELYQKNYDRIISKLDGREDY
ncbi:MAG: hypothetical protein WC618_03980 [Patescibacteria group bacterium]